jgi:hypothetical protein
MTNLEKILKQKIQQNIKTTKTNLGLWIKLFFKNQLNYELAKQEHTQLWKQWQRKKNKLDNNNKRIKTRMQ